MEVWAFSDPVRSLRITDGVTFRGFMSGTVFFPLLCDDYDVNSVFSLSV